eukprot:6214791-Pleurochrysis_carterae.AAC.5
MVPSSMCRKRLREPQERRTPMVSKQRTRSALFQQPPPCRLHTHSLASVSIRHLLSGVSALSPPIWKRPDLDAKLDVSRPMKPSSGCKCAYEGE